MPTVRLAVEYLISEGGLCDANPPASGLDGGHSVPHESPKRAAKRLMPANQAAGRRTDQTYETEF